VVTLEAQALLLLIIIMIPGFIALFIVILVTPTNEEIVETIIKAKLAPYLHDCQSINE